MDSACGVKSGYSRGWRGARSARRVWRRSGLGLAAALLICGALMTNGASAAPKHGTSVSLQIASNGQGLSGRVRSSKAACVKHRALRLQKREGRKWVTVARLKSSGSGRFKRSLNGAGKYRVSVTAKGSCGGGTSSPVTASHGSPGPSSAPCRMALTHDTYDGFHIAIPAGWELSTLHGELEVQKDVAADEAVLVWPGIQTSGLTPSSFFQSQLSNFEAQSASEGRPITITGNHSKGGVPSVTFTAPVNGQTVQGYATVLTQQYKTALSSSQVAFVAYWAPAAAFGAETATLSGVAACYGPERASIYHVFQDQAFTYMMPPGWSVSNETQDALDLIDGRGDYVTFELVGGNQFNSPQSLINVFLAGDQIGPVNALWTASTPSQQVQNGATQSSEYEEFTAPWRGQQVHGLIFALTDVGIGFNTGVVRIVLSSADGWNAVNGALIQMVGAIQHNFTQDLQEIQQLNQQWQNFSNQVANFDDILNNQQLTQDPTTGIYYYAPYDSYEVDGPNGPGYYENDQKLNIINR
jgi:hypothetical protein